MKFLILFFLFFSFPVLADDWKYDVEPPKKIEDSYYYDSIHGKPQRVKPETYNNTPKREYNSYEEYKRLNPINPND